MKGYVLISNNENHLPILRLVLYNYGQDDEFMKYTYLEIALDNFSDTFR